MINVKPKIIYSDRYDIKFFGAEKLHPFDSCKYGHIWQELKEIFLRDRSILNSVRLEPSEPISYEEIRKIHSQDYLDSLQDLSYVAKALEMPLLALVPNVDFIRNEILKSILEPMKWATMGTVLAAREALNGGIAINLSGGYHHASANRGEGFCIYSDIAIAISCLRDTGEISANDKILVIDLDAHQGNGIERIFYKDKNIYFFDVYNKDIYPKDDYAKQRIDFKIEISSGTSDEEYLDVLNKSLIDCLNKIYDEPKLVFYNAGTDIYELDPLGQLQVSKTGIFERDKFIFNTLGARIPLAMVLSGGYTRNSYALVAESVAYILKTWRTVS